MGYIDAEQVRKLAREMMKNEYGRYLMEMVLEEEANNNNGS